MCPSDVGSSQLGRPSTVAKEYTLQIQKLVLNHLNSVVATQLLGLVDGLRSSCIGSLLVLNFFLLNFFENHMIVCCYLQITNY